MKIIKIFLYLICFFSASWVALLLAGPTLLKSLVSLYSNNQMIASKITITPKLDINIGRLQFAFQDQEDVFFYEGFSRSVNISWSVFGDGPFLKAQFGPTFVEDTISADNLTIYTPVFSEIDFDQILLKADITNLKVKSVNNPDSLTIEAVLLRKEDIIKDVLIDIPYFNFETLESWVSSGTILQIDEIDLTIPIDGQAIIVEISAEKFENFERKVILSDIDGLLTLDKTELGFRIHMEGFKFGEPQNVLEGLSAQGTFEGDGVLRNARIELSNISSAFGPKDWPSFVIDIVKVGDDAFELEVFGNLGATQLTAGENFIGELPESSFEINLDYNSDASKINAVSEVILKNEALPNIVGTGHLNFRLGSSAKISDCIKTGCDLLSFDFGYNFFFDQESISIASACYSAPCYYSSISHSLKTSDTGEIFTIIGQSKILNPIYIAYLYSLLSTGIKADKGHEIRIN